MYWRMFFDTSLTNVRWFLDGIFLDLKKPCLTYLCSLYVQYFSLNIPNVSMKNSFVPHNSFVSTTILRKSLLTNSISTNLREIAIIWQFLKTYRRNFSLVCGKNVFDYLFMVLGL